MFFTPLSGPPSGKEALGMCVDTALLIYMNTTLNYILYKLYTMQNYTLYKLHTMLLNYDAILLKASTDEAVLILHAACSINNK